MCWHLNYICMINFIFNYLSNFWNFRRSLCPTFLSMLYFSLYNTVTFYFHWNKMIKISHPKSPPRPPILYSQPTPAIQYYHHLHPPFIIYFDYKSWRSNQHLPAYQRLAIVIVIWSCLRSWNLGLFWVVLARSMGDMKWLRWKTLWTLLCWMGRRI